MKADDTYIHSELLMEQLPQLLDQTPAVPLRITGSSMTPFLAGGRDTAYLSKLPEILKPGDMVLYRRHSGDYILHRIYAVDAAGFSMAGDAHQLVEHGVSRKQLLAVVTAVQRQGKLLKPGNFLWNFYAGPWRKLLPIRRKLIGLISFLTGKRR